MIACFYGYLHGLYFNSNINVVTTLESSVASLLEATDDGILRT